MMHLLKIFLLLLSQFLVIEVTFAFHQQDLTFDIKNDGWPAPKKDFVTPSVPPVSLPGDLSPEHYALRIRPILNDPLEDPYTAPGSVKIVLKCHNVTDQVTLHRHPSLIINESSISLFHLNEDGSHGNEVEMASTSYDEQNFFQNFHLTTSLQSGQRYELSMDFVAQVNDGMSGLYRAQYQTPDGDTRYLATTQFQTYGARMAFPCFDEPGFKSTYDITIGRQTGLNSLSNAQPKEIGVVDPQLPPGWLWDVYNRTVPMSTYIVAIIVSDFVCETADPTLFDKPVRVCGPGHQIVDQKGAVVPVQAAARIINFLQNVFKYPYEMYKLDNVAVPWEYFAAGAMENWGLVTYRDNYLLYYANESSEANRSKMLNIICHEFAHQWFGNLLTNASWLFGWLNEGFAGYVSYLVTGVAPEFDTEREILIEKVQNAMGLDVGINDPVYSDVDEHPKNMPYLKGASLLRMVQGFLGKETFLTALAEYVRRFAYQSVTQNQLFTILDEFAHDGPQAIPHDLTMKDIMDTWTLQSGHPLIQVSKVNQTHVQIAQQTFLPVDSTKFEETSQLVSGLKKVREEQEGQLWHVPVAMATADNSDFGNHTPALWLSTESSLFEHDSSNNNWIFLNPDAMAFFRVQYDDELLTLIQNQLAENPEAFSGLSRSQLIDDYFNLAKHGHEPIEKALDLTTYLDQEDDHIVWYTVFTHFTKSRVILENYPEFNAYLLPKLESVLDRLLVNWTLPLNQIGFGSRVIFASKLLDWSCTLQSQKCRQFAKSLMEQWINAPDSLSEIIPPDFEPTMLCHGVSELGQSAVDFLYDQYLNTSPFSLHKQRFLDALACAESNFLEGFLLKNVLNINDPTTTSHNSLQNHQVVSFVQMAISRHPELRPLILSVVDEHAQKLKTNLGEMVLAEIVGGVSQFYRTLVQFKECAEMVKKMKTVLPTQIRQLNDTLSNVQENIKWFDNFGKATLKWFQAHWI